MIEWNSLIGVIIGATIATGVPWIREKYEKSREEKEKQIRHAQKVCFVLLAQLYEFIKIKEYFSQVRTSFGLGFPQVTDKYLFGDHSFIRQTDIICLFFQNSEVNISIVRELLFLENEFSKLLLDIEEYNQIPSNNNEKILLSIKYRINNIDIYEKIKNLQSFLEEFFGSSKNSAIFPKVPMGEEFNKFFKEKI